MNEKTVGEVYDEFTDEQKKVVKTLIDTAIKYAKSRRYGCIKKRDLDVFYEFTEDQKKVVYFMIGFCIENGYNNHKELYSKIGE